MTSLNAIHVAVLPGDGIGLEVMEPCLACLDRLARRFATFSFDFETLAAGAGLYAQTGDALPEETVKRAGQADVMLLGAMGLPDVRHADGSEIVPQIELREIFELYAGVRPVKTFPGCPVPLADPRAQSLDFVLVRESTEGLFWSRKSADIRDDNEARDTMRITRTACERLFKFSYELAAHRKATRNAPGRLSCIDKANVFASFAFFRKIFDECGETFPEVIKDYRYVDAAALALIRNPWDFDVMVTENMFGDILSDAAAALMGGMGMAPSGDIGDDKALFQPCHGTAPDIMGTGKANPTAMLLSGAMMLDWLGQKFSSTDLIEAAAVYEAAVMSAYRDETLRPFEAGGQDGLKPISDAVLAQL